jgi:hypothetical protein
MAKNKSLIGFFIVLFLAFIAVLAYFSRGFIPTHDGEYHIIRFAEFDRMIRSGYLFPRWAPTLNSGYGLPLFEFMYPLVNYIASGLHTLGMGFVESFKTSMGLGYLVSTIFCYLWLRKRFGVFAAVAGTIAGSFVPYWFVELFVRGVVGEAWAIAILFATLYFVEISAPLLFSITVALLVLSHNILAMLFFPVIIIYILYRQNWKWFLYLLLGTGLSAWFWLPAVFESKYMQGLNTVNFRDHFATLSELLIPSWGTEFSSVQGGNKMSYQIGIGPLLWILAGSYLAIFRKRKEQIVLLLCIVTAISLTLSYTLPIWNILPVLQFAQYPWRLLVYLIPFIAYLAALSAVAIKKRWVIYLLIALSVVCSISYTRGAVYQPRTDEHYLTKLNFTDGTSSMGNALSTKWTEWKQVRPQAPITDLNDGKLSYETIYERYLDKKYHISFPDSQTARIHILYFPGWQVTLDGAPISINYSKNGTIDVTVPAGDHVLRVFMTETPIRIASDVLSVFLLASTLIWGILRIYAHRN